MQWCCEFLLQAFLQLYFVFRCGNPHFLLEKQITNTNELDLMMCVLNYFLSFIIFYVPWLVTYISSVVILHAWVCCKIRVRSESTFSFKRYLPATHHHRPNSSSEWDRFFPALQLETTANCYGERGGMHCCHENCVFWPQCTYHSTSHP